MVTVITGMGMGTGMGMEVLRIPYGLLSMILTGNAISPFPTIPSIETS